MINIERWGKVAMGTVVWTGQLPKAYNGTTGFNKLTPIELQQYGFYAVIEDVIPAFNPDLEKISYGDYYFNGAAIVRDIAVVNLSENELELKAMTIEADTSEIGILTLPQIESYIDNNVTTLAGTRLVLKKLSKLLLSVFKTKGLL